MNQLTSVAGITMPGAAIITKARDAGLDISLLYEAVIDLSSQGLQTAGSINLAAGILLNDLGLPGYFFKTITKSALVNLLQFIAASIRTIDGRIRLHGRVAHVDFNLDQGDNMQKVRIATEETRDSMEIMLEQTISGHRREYYYSPENGYYTYVIRPETVGDFSRGAFAESRFLFALAGDYQVTPRSTRKRYEDFLRKAEQQVIPLVDVYNLAETGETRLMFNSDFESAKLPVFRKILADHGFVMTRAYWEPYLSATDVPSSICSLYIQGELPRSKEAELLATIRSFLAFAVKNTDRLYLKGQLSFEEMLFAGNAIDFTHLFIFKESENASDREILQDLHDKDHRETFAKRLQSSNRAIYGYSLIEELVNKHVDLIVFLHDVFAAKFDPRRILRATEADILAKRAEFERMIASRFLDFSLGYDIFSFMFKFITATLKTNFYKAEKRSFAFRLDNSILDPLVFSQFVFGIFYVNGHYACGTHLRAADIARGGLRLLRITRANYVTELDNAVLLNYALGPKAQRMKHKDICESGSKGVVVPHPQYGGYGREALFDYTEGIMDLMQPDSAIIDWYGRPELIFFGPDEGTAPFMDAVSLRAKERGYRHWRTITTGKSFGIPHDTYGLLDSGELFGLFDRDREGVELQIEGSTVVQTDDMDAIYEHIGGRITTSGMTTTGIMSAFRALIEEAGEQEEALNLMITGGPDGDLGANEIQCYRGRICLIIDGGCVLFDPQGLDARELTKIAFRRNSKPRANAATYPLAKLGPKGFLVPIGAKNVTLPDGRRIEDGALFHRTFLIDPANRAYVAEANIRAFIPCGGKKDTINQANVRQFLSLFAELRFIVEGANVFFDDVARRHIAASTPILQIKDSSANKGGVFSSSVAEVLTAFLLQETYEATLLDDVPTRCALVRDIMGLVGRYAALETRLLLKLHQGPGQPHLFDLSEQSSERIFAFQDDLTTQLPVILADGDLVWQVLEHYVPEVLRQKLGRERILTLLAAAELQPYRDAILTKKLASMAFYRFGHDWEAFLVKAKANLIPVLRAVFAGI